MSAYPPPRPLAAGAGDAAAAARDAWAQDSGVGADYAEGGGGGGGGYGGAPGQGGGQGQGGAPGRGGGYPGGGGGYGGGHAGRGGPGAGNGGPGGGYAATYGRGGGPGGWQGGAGGLGASVAGGAAPGAAAQHGGGRPGYHTPAYGVPAYAGGHAPPSGALPARRPAPGYELPPERQPVPYDPDQMAGTTGRRFAPAMGIPAASAPPPRRKPFRPFDISVLEPIPKESVELWKTLERGFPAYFKATALEEACFGFLQSLLAPADEPGRTLTLEVKKRDDGSIQVKEFPDGGEVTIGTHAQNRVQVSGASVSRRHARLAHDERGWCLVDQGSSNGTWYKGERVQPGYAYPLKSGEAFSIPGYEMHVRFAEEKAAPKLQKLHVASLKLESAQRLAESVPTHAQVAIVRLEPANVRAFVEVDLPLATLCVSRVLGSPAASASAAGLATALKDGAPTLRPLSEVEKGVLELLFVKLLDAAQARWGADAELTFHLEALVDGKDPRVARTAAGIKQCVLATVGLDFDGRRDSVRVALPDTTVQALAPRFERVVARAGEHGLELCERFRDLTALAEVALSGSVGHAKLTRAELQACTVGDVFVPDELTIGVEGGALKGKVELKVVGGRGRAKVVCELAELSDERVVVQVASVEVAPHGRSEARKVPGDGEVEYQGEGGEGGEGGGLSTEEIAAAAGLETGEDGAGAAVLDDVPLPLVVELGRVSMTVRELASLRKGQVIELGHDPKDPVSLVFEGHVIGAGKLVNVEGEIGVQITSLGR
jgi:type III secretion system YscQ/HrcQ family protein